MPLGDTHWHSSSTFRTYFWRFLILWLLLVPGGNNNITIILILSFLTKGHIEANTTVLEHKKSLYQWYADYLHWKEHQNDRGTHQMHAWGSRDVQFPVTVLDGNKLHGPITGSDIKRITPQPSLLAFSWLRNFSDFSNRRVGVKVNVTKWLGFRNNYLSVHSYSIIYHNYYTFLSFLSFN